MPALDTNLAAWFWEKGKVEENKRIITVLLTRYYSTFSDVIYWISGRGYTHASLSLDDEGEVYYSFNFKGFRKEHPGRSRKKCRKSVCFRLEISGESFDRIKQRLEEMEQNTETLHYSWLSLFLCLLHIPCKIENHYFCSQFVAEMLELTGSICLNKKASLYLPNHLPEVLKHQRCLKEIVYSPV